MNRSVESGAAWDLYQQFVLEGEARVNRAIETKESEGVYLDFKASKDPDTRQPTSTLTPKGEEHLAKLISAFANTLGGVIVWGVAEQNKRAAVPEPIPDVAMFVRALETAVPKCAAPAVIGVRSHPIFVGGGSSGYAVTYVPRGHTAHQCVNGGAYNYWNRNAESTTVLDHVRVEALIMSRARPELTLFISSSRVRIRMDGIQYLAVTLGVQNAGSVVARDVALSVSMSDLDLAVEKNAAAEGEIVHIVTASGEIQTAKLFALPSSEVVHPGVVRELCELQHPFTNGNHKRSLRFDVWIHADGFRSDQISREIKATEIADYILQIGRHTST